MSKYEDNIEETKSKIRIASNNILEDPYFEEANIEEAKIELDEVLKEGGEEILMREKLMFEPQSAKCEFIQYILPFFGTSRMDLFSIRYYRCNSLRWFNARIILYRF